MRSYDPWDACVTTVKSWGNLKWVMAVLMEKLLGLGQLHPCPIVTSDVMGAGHREVCLSFLASELERPQKGRKEGRTRDRERLSGSVCVCVRVCKCVCMRVSTRRGRGGGGSPDRGALSSGPRTVLFSSQAINVTAASNAR